MLSGLVGGLISSTNVTLTFARTSRSEPALERALAFGAVGANTVPYPRVLAVTAVLDAAIVPVLLPYFAGPALVATLAAALGARRRPTEEAPPPVPARNPLQLSSALQMAALFQIVPAIVNVAQAT